MNYSVLITNCTFNDEEFIEDEKFHHLKNVCRIKIEDEIVVLNGKGSICKYEVLSIEKRKIKIRKKESEIFVENYHNLTLLIAIPKKEYFEEIVRIAIECGVRKIVPIVTKYSQRNKDLLKRIDKIIESAMIQSNNAYYIEITNELDLEKLDFKEYSQFLYYSTSKNEVEVENVSINEKIAIFIGPEGGLTSEEEEYIKSFNNSVVINLNIPIMKAITAVPVAIGQYLTIAK